jgi:hypothetical protein
MLFDRTKWDRHARNVYRHYAATDEHREWHAYQWALHSQRTPLCWGNEYFWENDYHTWKYHFAHTCSDDPSLVAFFENDEKGARGILTKIKPGRYLTRYFAGTINEKQIKYFAEWQTLGSMPPSIYDNYVLKFASNPDDIVRVYEHGPSSCMVRCFRSLEEHQARPYGAGDLAIAYLEGEPPPGQLDKTRTVVARCLTWPAQKAASRIYPTAHYWEEDGFESVEDSSAAQGALEKALRREGYKFLTEGASFEGARLLKVRHPRSQYDDILPYVDGPFTPRLRDGAYYLSGR